MGRIGVKRRILGREVGILRRISVLLSGFYGCSESDRLLKWVEGGKEPREILNAHRILHSKLIYNIRENGAHSKNMVRI